MPGTGTPESITTLRPPAHAWQGLAWKVLVAVTILLFMAAGIPISSSFVMTWVWATLLVWGGLVVMVAAGNLFADLGGLRWAWTALAVGAYAALSVPAIVLPDPSKLVDALGPVVALTLVAHLARRDLSRALRDWAVLVGLALYAALGITSMWTVISSFSKGDFNGLLVFAFAVLLPPLVLEIVLVLMRRVFGVALNWGLQLGAIVIATIVSLIGLSLTQLNSATPMIASLAFQLLAGLLVGGALLVSLLTRPLAEAASRAWDGSSVGGKLGRALVELSHGPVLIALALYVPLRLLLGSVG